jgi:aminopeptidase N
VTKTLTRDEARDRARLLTVRACAVSLDLTRGDSTFSSTTRITFDCREPGAETFVELAAATVHSVELNGTRLDPGEVVEGDRIRLPGLAADNRLVVTADCSYSRTGEGLHRFVDPVDQAVYLYSQFETYDAHRMYCCFDQPDLKTPFAFDVTAPADWVCVSNAAVVGEPQPVEGQPVEGPDGVRHWRFADTPPISTYITALVAGPYYEVHDEHDGIPLGLYCRRSLADYLDPDELFTVTKQGFDFFHRAFDVRYPFGKYDQLFVPEFNAGAMENAGCVTFLEDYIFRSRVTIARRERRAETILHEMAHMWFGDLVTMRWWDDLWLNESFASYMAVHAQVTSTRFTEGWTTFANVEKTWARRQDQLPSTHPVVADAPDIEAVKANFDGITYAKGASLLKQLVAWVGVEEFFAGLREYFREHAWGNTELADLLAALERSSGRDLAAWSQEWLQTAGVATLLPRYDIDGSGVFTSVTIEQTAPPDHPTLRSHRLAIGLYDRNAAGALVRRDRVELDISGRGTDVPKLVGVPRPDLLLVNDDDLTYAKVRLDPHSFATLVESIDRIEESLPRALCWSAAWDMTRDAEIPTRDYARLVLRGVGAESQVGVVQSLLSQARLAVLLYGDPSRRQVGLGDLADGAVALTRQSEPGSDLQLAGAQSLAAAAIGPEHIALLCGLLDGSDRVPGLSVDTDLRWSFVVRLAAVGELDDAAIQAELDRDPTSTGVRRAASARAARPLPEAKEAAWVAVVDSDQLSNHLQVATMAGFAQPEQVELLEPYVERYFASVAGLWRTRSMETAQTITEMLFPSWSVRSETVARVDAYLRDEAPQPGLRRCLVEGRDGLARALRAQERDIAAARA